ncbi:putative group 1 glycosyl transferase [Chondrocystis sp. NIES-4102]|nr:putative group 1 glycosyl transferase [Chondrocystis sp. NIES-4102]
MIRKILIATTIPGTIEDFLLPFVRYFRNLGWQVDGMALDITQDAVCVAEFDHVWDVEWSRNPLDPNNLVVAVPVIQKIVTQGNYDLVHVHTPVAAFVTRYAINKLKNQPKPQVIYTAHGFHFHKQGNFITNLIFLTLEKLAGGWTDYLITINREDEIAAKKYRLLPGDRIFYTPGIGLDIQEYDLNQVSESEVMAVRQELGLTPEDKLLLCIAEFTPNKRHRDQLIALKKLQRPDVHLAFAGDGQIRSQIEQLTLKLGLEKQVHFLGFRPDIPVLICASLATLLTSQREGLPRSIMEAFCAATPVIGTKIRGIQDLVADDCGLLVEVGDTDGLAQAIKQVLDNPQKTAQMGENGRQKIKSYSVDRIIELYTNIYNQALVNHE